MSPRRVDLELTARRREALIKAGYAEILEKGLHATTIDSVVARANSSKGGALHYFRTKEDLFYAVLEWLLSELTHSLDQVASSQEFRRERPDDAAATIRALVDGYCLQWLMDADNLPVEVFRERCGAVLGAYLLRPPVETPR